jgi:hypothetical protein
VAAGPRLVGSEVGGGPERGTNPFDRWGRRPDDFLYRGLSICCRSIPTSCIQGHYDRGTVLQVTAEDTNQGGGRREVGSSVVAYGRRHTEICGRRREPGARQGHQKIQWLRIPCVRGPEEHGSFFSG